MLAFAPEREVGGEAVDTEVCLRLVAAMAALAVFGQERADLIVKVPCLRLSVVRGRQRTASAIGQTQEHSDNAQPPKAPLGCSADKERLYRLNLGG